MDYPEALRYTEEHTWVAQENGTGTIGITAYAQDQLGEVIYVELPEVGEKIDQRDAFGVVESVKAVHDLFSPVSGEVVDVNAVLEEMPEVVNSDPYGDGWMIRVALSDEDELKDLLAAKDYRALVEEA